MVERTLTKEGVVCIGPETDPQEMLKLGSYVGSCLTPGGVCDYSAVAITFDANKQVLYARDAKGKVVGRQLVTISKERELVCFGVYPTYASKEMKAFFECYDLTLAQYLGLRPFRGGEYEIEELHGLAWYDDGALALGA